MSRFTLLLTDILVRHAAPIFIACLLLSGVGAFYSAKLFMNLRTDLEELLPNTARSVMDLNEVTSRLESIDNLSVLVLSDDPEASKRFVNALVKRLESVPKEIIASVEYNIAKELDFFEKRRALYIDEKDLLRIRDYIKNRIEYEETLYNPLTIFSGVEVSEPRMDFVGLKQKYESKVSAYSRFPEGYYATPDGRKRVILVYKPGKTSGIDSVHKIKNAVVQAVEEVNPKSFSPTIQVLYTGGVQNTIEEQEALVEDLLLSTVVVAVLVTLAMLVFFRAVRATFALMVALFMGTFWTFGISYFAVGYLNANSAFLGSIVLGNGINFPIILLARYLEERRKNRSHLKALRLTMKHTSSATWTAALAAGLSYGSLALTSFRGFKQFGIIGLIGMVLCWIAGTVVLPTLLTLLERRESLKPKRPMGKSYFAGTMAMLVQQKAKTVVAVSVVLSVASLLCLFRYDKTILETDLSKLRNKESMERGSGFLSLHVDEIFQRYLTPMVALPKTREHALLISEKLKTKQKAEGEESLIAAVQTMDDFIPKNQPAKIQLIKEIEKMLPPKVIAELGTQEKRLAQSFLTAESKQSISLHDLPDLVISKFTERDGSVGKLVLVEPPIGKATLDGDNLLQFIRDLRVIADSVAPGTPIAGALPISADMIASISKDGPKATLFAFAAVILLVVVLFRKPRYYVPVLFALCIGVLWLGGFILGFWFKINFLNFIALPITFGIGVDYAVNIYSRYREEGANNITKVIQDTGGAVALCSFTTTVGWGSLLIAQNQAFVSFGWLAVIGEITCLAAAMLTLPAFLLLRQQWKAEKNVAQ